MLKGKKGTQKVWIIGLIVTFITLIATPVLAKTISVRGIGAVPLIAFIIGIIIVLLQLIPAMILFFSFIGTVSAMVFKGKKASEEVVDEDKETIPIAGYNPIPINNEFQSVK